MDHRVPGRGTGAHERPCATSAIRFKIVRWPLVCGVAVLSLGML